MLGIGRNFTARRVEEKCISLLWQGQWVFLLGCSESFCNQQLWGKLRALSGEHWNLLDYHHITVSQAFTILWQLWKTIASYHEWDAFWVCCKKKVPSIYSFYLTVWIFIFWIEYDVIDKLQNMFCKTQMINYIRIMSGCQCIHIRKKIEVTVNSSCFLYHNGVITMIRIYGSTMLMVGLISSKNTKTVMNDERWESIVKFIKPSKGIYFYYCNFQIL